MMLSAQTLHVAINRPCDEVYAFLSRPENFPLWAKGLANSLRREGERRSAGAEAPAGIALIPLTP